MCSWKKLTLTIHFWPLSITTIKLRSSRVQFQRIAKPFPCSVSVIFIGPVLYRCIIKYICPCPAWHGQSNLNSNWSDNSHQSNLLDLSRSNLPISLLLESTAWTRKIASLNLAFIKVRFAQFYEHSSTGFQWKILGPALSKCNVL